jgi:hypothetical protein
VCILLNSLLVDIVLDLLERPRDEGVDLNEPALIDLNGAEVGAVGALRPTATSNDSEDAKLGISTRTVWDSSTVSGKWCSVSRKIKGTMWICSRSIEILETISAAAKPVL